MGAARGEAGAAVPDPGSSPLDWLFARLEAWGRRVRARAVQDEPPPKLTSDELDEFPERCAVCARQIVYLVESCVQNPGSSWQPGGSLLRGILDVLPVGAILLDPSLHILALNRRAESILSEGDGLSARRNRLVAARPRDTRELQSLTAAAGTEWCSRSVLALSRPSLRPPLQILVTRVAGGRGATPMTALLVSDPTVLAAPTVEDVRRLFGLTAAEARVARSLVRGESLPQIARQMSVQENTVRWHLKQIYVKTGTHGQVDLVRLLLTSPLAIAPDPPSSHSAPSGLPGTA
jgi:DNA-binding CsgD family transcriptional regulator